MKKVFIAVILIFLAGVFCYFSDRLPVIGDAGSPPNTHVSNYYIEHSEEDTGSPNVVSGTLADYRGFDTMWETTVMFIAGLCATLILVWDMKSKEEH